MENSNNVFDNTAEIISVNNLIADNKEWKEGHNRAMAIIYSSFAIVSVIASSILIAMIWKSKNKLSTVNHRLLLGMSIADILYSLSCATFQTMVPSDLSYMVWNARGNTATCDAVGAITVLGMVAVVFYSCSLNLYYLAVVRYSKPEAYISKRMEPLFHGIPTLMSLILSITLLVKKNYNSDEGGGCNVFTYNPPHCVGYENGVVREGFEIPCGRGRDEFLAYIWAPLLAFPPPIIVGISLGMIYRSVSKQERVLSRYGRVRKSAMDAVAGMRASSIARRRCFGERRCFRNRRSFNTNDSNSRAVVHRACAYSISYFLAWSWPTLYIILQLAGRENSLAFRYLWSIFGPLQGFYSLIIFMYPKARAAKQSHQARLSWPRAFAIAFWSGLGVDRNRSNAGFGTLFVPRFTAGLFGMKHNKTGTNPNGTAPPNEGSATNAGAEEEKTEIVPPLDSGAHPRCASASEAEMGTGAAEMRSEGTSPREMASLDVVVGGGSTDADGVALAYHEEEGSTKETQRAASKGNVPTSPARRVESLRVQLRPLAKPSDAAPVAEGTNRRQTRH
ncbi:hypothetical protein ACHAWF_007466 [Thalassiosira exigua]